MISRSVSIPALLATGALSVAFVTVPVSAQGSLSTQGFGAPVSGMSLRARGSAGALSESDALSPFNPAALGGVQRIVLTAQAEPEFRTLSLANGSKERTNIQRVPLMALILPAGHGVAGSFSLSGFLDRSFSTVTTGSAVVDGHELPTRDRLDMRGGISDMRAAVGWAVNSRVKVGVAGHVFMGENIGSRDRTFPDTLKFGSVLDSSQVSYLGTAVSMGGEVRVLQSLALTGSFRSGQSIKAKIRDSTATTATVPARIGLSLRYDGIAGSVFSVGVERIAWSDMQSLGSNLTQAHDALNFSAGAEVQGPEFRGVPILLRAGYARNELPFSLSSEKVKESRLAAGLSLPIARDAASLDFSIQRANRSLVGNGTKESAWLLGVGVQIRP